MSIIINPRMYPLRIYNVCVKSVSCNWKSKILLINVSPMKKGLKEAIVLMRLGNVSIGKMLEEKNRKTNPIDMVAIVPVSSDFTTDLTYTIINSINVTKVAG